MNHCVPCKRVLCSSRCIGVGCEDSHKSCLCDGVLFTEAHPVLEVLLRGVESLNGCLCLKWLLPELFTGE